MHLPRMPRSSLPFAISVHRPRADWLTALIVMLLIVHVAVEVMGGPERVEEMGLYDLFGLSRPALLTGNGWQLVTYSFLHGSWLHLIMNATVIYAIGGRVTTILGNYRSASIYAGGVVGGGLLHFVIFPADPLGVGMTPSYIPLVGASGGMMALLTAFGLMSPDSRMCPLMVSARNLGRGIMLGSLFLFLLTPGMDVPALGAVGTWVVTEQAFGGVVFLISHPCHLGGGVVGLFSVRRLMREPVSLEELRWDRKRREEQNHE